MPGHFPAPYPDELLYSVCARFASRAGYASVKSVLEELFGSPTAAAVIDLPNRLSRLAAGLPANSSMTAERLIALHTLLPFFNAFQPPGRVKQLRDDLKGCRGSAGHLRSGIIASRIPAPDHLRFCPGCRQEDEECFGETYWRRLHQLPGVEVCPSHQTFLENSSVSLRSGRKHLQFIPAGQAVRAMPVRCVDIENRDHRTLLQLARDSVWVLEHPGVSVSLKALHIRYLRLLISRGLATYTGSIHVKKLLHEFGSYCSPALLKLLNCECRGSNIEKSNWLLRLVRTPKYAQHPLYHLLLIQFLGCTVKEFFQLSEESGTFGEGPWPCLNPAAAHYRRPAIMEYHLGDRLRYGKPTGRFSCECGFAYVRTGPDSSPEDRFRVGRIISFGQVWEAKLKQLWKNSSLSLSEMGRRLGVDPLTIRRHATRLKLSFSRPSRELKPLNVHTQLKGGAVAAAWEEKRRGCRSKWLSAMRRGRKGTPKSLRNRFPREYAWLQHYDSEWLKGHKPRSQRRNQSTTGVDWEKRDVEYATAVRDAALRLKDASCRPAQVTRTAIGRALGAITLLRQKLHRMPLTAQVLAGVVETREQYAVRRVWWAAGLYCTEGILPGEWQLVLRANVYSLREAAEIRLTVEAAISMIRSSLPREQLLQSAS